MFSFGSQTGIMSDITCLSILEVRYTDTKWLTTMPLHTDVFTYIFFMVYLAKLSVTQTIQGQLTGLSVNNEFKGHVQKELSPIWHAIPAFVNEQWKTSAAESVLWTKLKAGTSWIQVTTVTTRTSLLTKIQRVVHNFHISMFCISGMLFDLWHYTQT